MKKPKIKPTFPMAKQSFLHPLVHVLVLAILVSASGVSFYFKFPEKIPTASADTQTYSFTNGNDYTMDNDQIDVTAGAAVLKYEINYGADFPFADIFPYEGVLHYVTAIDDNHIAIAKQDTTDGNVGKVIICERSGTTVSTCGAWATFSDTNLASKIAIAKVDSTHLAVAYYSPTTGTGLAIIGTVDVGTDSITFDSLETKQFNAAGTGEIAVQALDASNIVITYQDQGNGDDGYAIIGTISAGDTLDFSGSTAVEFLDTTGGVSMTDIAVLDSTHFVVAYVDTNGARKRSIVGTVSGTAITFGTESGSPLSPGSGTGGADIGIDMITSDRFVMAFNSGPSGSDPHSVIGTVSGTGAGATIAYTASFNEFQLDATTYTSVARIGYVPGFDLGYFVMAFRDETGEASARIGGDVAGTIFYVHPEKEFTSGSTIAPAAITVANMVETTDGGAAVFVVGYKNSDNDDGVIKLASVDYNNDVPSIEPNTSLSPGDVISWDSFSATETKPANTEIYYQLSDDDGVTWQYWNGSSWTTATLSTHYNTSSVVSTNIGSFPTAGASNTLLFKAFLETTDGQSTPQLDNIDITYTLAPTVDIRDDSSCTNTLASLNLDLVTTMYVRVVDSNNAGAGTVSATALNTTNTDSETFTLTEGASGVFCGGVPVAISPTPTSSNGTLEGINGNNFTVQYEAVGTEILLDDFESYADTAAMQAGVDWDDLLFDAYDVTGSLPSELITTGPEAGNTSNQWFQKIVDASGPDGLLGVDNVNSTLTTATESTLASPLADTDTTIDLVDASMFVTTGEDIYINGDLINYTGVAGNTLTGVTGIQAGGHAGGSTVFPRLVNLNLTDASAFTSPADKVRVEDEIMQCESANVGNTLMRCYRHGATDWDNPPTHSAGTVVYQYDDNPYGVNTVYTFGGLDFSDVVADFTNRSVVFDLYVDDKNNLNATGSRFGWLDPSDPFGIPNVTLLLDDSNLTAGPSAKIIDPADLTNAAWQTITIPISEFSAGADITDVAIIHFFAATGDGTLGSGTDMTIKIDNVYVGPYQATDSITATTTPGIAFKTDGTYAADAANVTVGDDLFIQLTDAGQAGTVTQTVIITTGVGDRESIELTETGASTGIFRAQISTSAAAPTLYNDIVDGVGGDTVSAYITELIENFESYANAAAMNTAFADNSTVPDDVPVLISPPTGDAENNTQYFKKNIPDTNAAGMVQALFPATALDASGKTFELDLYLNDPQQLHPTGHTFSGSTPGGELAEDFSILFFQTGFAGFSEKIFDKDADLTTGWQHLSFSSASVPAWGALPAADMSDIFGLFVAAITGDEVIQAAVGDLEVRLDNFVMVDLTAADSTLSMLAAGGGGGGSGGGIITTSTTSTPPPAVCPSAFNVESLGALLVSEPTRDAVELHWAKPSQVVQDYIIKRGLSTVTDPNQMATVGTAGASATMYVDRTAEPGYRYNYAVLARNACGLTHPNPPLVSIFIPPTVADGAAFDLNLNLVVKTQKVRDEQVIQELKSILQEAQSESFGLFAGGLVAQAGTSDSSLTTLTPLVETCSQATAWVKENETNTFVSSSPTTLEQFLRKHAEALAYENFFCNLAADQPVDLSVFYESVFFLREGVLKTWYSQNLSAFSPNYPRLALAAKDYLSSKITDLIQRAISRVETRQTLKQTLEEQQLLYLSLSSVDSLEDIRSQEALRQAILSIPGIENLFRGHKETYTLEIWHPGSRSTPVRTIEFTTNILGEATVNLERFTEGTYDFTITKPLVLRKALSGIDANRMSMTLDFTRGLGTARSAYLRFGDFNNDGSIDARDFEAMMTAIREANGTGVTLKEIDLSGDGAINLSDFVNILQNWGKNE